MRKSGTVTMALLVIMVFSQSAVGSGDKFEKKAAKLIQKFTSSQDDIGVQQLKNALASYGKGNLQSLVFIRDTYFCDKGLMDALPLRGKACSLLKKMHDHLKKETAKKNEQIRKETAKKPVSSPVCNSDLAAHRKACDDGNPDDGDTILKWAESN